MADLVTHASVAFLCRVPCRSRMVPVFVLGSVLPDVFSRVPSILAWGFHQRVHPLPDMLLYCWTPAHLPAGILVWTLLLTCLFREAERPAVFGNLLAGAGLHLFLDLLQHHHGQGYVVGFPFTDAQVELGLLGSEATVPWALPLAALAAITWWGPRLWGAARRKKRHRATPPSRSPRSRPSPPDAPDP